MTHEDFGLKYEESSFKDIDFNFQSILWRQWFYCNQALTFGKTEIFNNAVQALEITLTPYIDPTYQKRKEDIEKNCEKEINNADPREKQKVTPAAKNDKYLKTYRALAELMSRSGITPQREVVAIDEDDGGFLDG